MFDPVSVENLLEAMTDEVAILDPSGVIVHVNTAWRSFCADNEGDAETFYIGQNYLDICGVPDGAGGTGAALIRDGVRQVLDHGEPFRAEYPCHSPTHERWFELTASAMDLGGRRGALVLHRNITTRYVARSGQPATAIAAEMLSALVTCSTDAILTFGLDGKVLTWNHAAQELYGYRAEEIVGKPLSILYPQDWPMPVTDYRDQIIAGTLEHFEVPRVTKTGDVRLVQVSGAPVRMPSGEIVAISNIHRDVTDLRRAEETRQIVAREAAHRAKNILTIVKAIERQTATGAKSVADFTTRFAARIDSLVSTTDLLVSGNWTEVQLEQLVRAQLALFIGSDSRGVSFGGPAVVVKPEVVQAVGMALHELATNCAKYGAIKDGRDGQVTLSWYENAGPGGGLRLDWVETGTAFDGPPATLGFGHVVLTRLARTMLDSTAELEFGRDGLRWHIDIPSDQYQLVAP